MDVVNSHVVRMKAYLTFEPEHDQIYEERSDPEQLKSIPTKAGARLLELAMDRNVRLVVLTGDAGHGKTHLCRVLCEKLLNLSPKLALALLNEHGDGQGSLGEVGGRSLHVVRDLSESTSTQAVEQLSAALNADHRVTVVCANEGKLRAVVAASAGRLDVLRETLEEGQRTGRCSVEQSVVLLDLNHQSVTAGGNESLLGDLLAQWVQDGRRWKACERCPAQDACPILFNRRKLNGDDDPVRGFRRREGLHLMLRVAEQTGQTITVRETLILTAFLITGGLDCERVQQNHRRRPEDHDWQYQHVFTQVFLDPPLSRDQQATLPLLRALGRFDPGRIAIRSVDDALSVETALPDGEFIPPDARASLFTPGSRKQARTEATRHRSKVAFLRRRDYFELETDDFWSLLQDGGTKPVGRAERLGFKYQEEFESIAGDNRDQAGSRATVRDQLLRGLEAVQDLRRGSRAKVDFAVVDPAYGNVSGNASILSNVVSVNRIEMHSLREQWGSIPGNTPDLPGAVDWLDRQVVISFESGSSAPVSLGLNLLQFEFVVRSAEGLSSRRFFQGDIRRILARLADLSGEGSGDQSRIEVVHGDKLSKIVVDREGRIICERS